MRLPSSYQTVGFLDCIGIAVKDAEVTMPVCDGTVARYAVLGADEMQNAGLIAARSYVQVSSASPGICARVSPQTTSNRGPSLGSYSPFNVATRRPAV
jgi:hypothetical protein